MPLNARTQTRAALSTLIVLVGVCTACRGSPSPQRQREHEQPAREAQSQSVLELTDADTFAAACAGAPEADDTAAPVEFEADPAIRLAVVKAIGRPLTARNLSVRPWRYRANTLLALVFAAVGEGGLKLNPLYPVPTFTSTKQLDAHIVMLEGDSAVKVVATASLVPVIETDPAWELNEPEFKLDLAPYEIRRGEYAFGVRFSHHVVFIAGESSCEDLYLFRLNGGVLSQVMIALVSTTDEQRGPNDLSSSESIVIVSPEMTRGYNDILVKTRSKFGPLLSDVPGTLFPEAGESTETQRWRWSGARYLPAR